MKTWKLWAHGLGAAAITAGAGAFVHYVSGHVSEAIPWRAIGTEAMIGAALYLFRSPLGPAELSAGDAPAPTDQTK